MLLTKIRSPWAIPSWFGSSGSSMSETASTSPASTSSSLTSLATTSDSRVADYTSSSTSLTPSTNGSELGDPKDDYGYGLSPTSFKALLTAEYPSLYSSELVHLDHAAAPPPPISAITSFSSSLVAKLYSNPHSHSPTQREVDQMRSRVMCVLFCLGDRDQEGWDLVWTSGTSASLKLIGERFPWSPGAEYRYLKESHTSLVGIRGNALAAGAAVKSLNIDSFLSPQDNGGLVLHAYPAQCNVTGSRLGIHPAQSLARLGKHDRDAVLVDAASYLSTSPLDLSSVTYEEAPDFVVGSFYKTYGHPTGLGFLLIKRSSAHFLCFSQNTYFGGGAIDALSVSAPYWVHPRGSNEQGREGVVHDRLENGTIPFLSVVALKCAMDAHQQLYTPYFSPGPTASLRAVSQHTRYLAHLARKEMEALNHWNGTSLVKIHSGEGSGRWEEDGPTIAFTLYTPNSASQPIGHTHLLNLATVANIHIRTGGLCNTGAVARICDLSDEELHELWEEGRVCGDGQEFGGNTGKKQLGLARISFGASSSVEDVHKFVDFLRRYFLISTAVVEMSKSAKQDYDTAASDRGIFLESLIRYPIKSCAGQSLASSHLSATGLLHDREFVLIDSASGETLSQKQFPRMALIRPSIDDDNVDQTMTVRATGMPDLIISLREDRNGVDIGVCGDRVASCRPSLEADEWFSKFLGMSCQLHRIAQPTPASPSCLMSPTDFGNDAPIPILFSNESPFTLISTSSVDAINEWIAADHKNDGSSSPVPASAFRANFAISTPAPHGLAPFREDALTHIRIGSQTFQVLARCRRCLMICVDQNTGVRMREPFCCLARHRRNGRRKVEFGIHLIWRGELNGTGTPSLDGSARPRVNVGDSIRWTTAQ